MFDDEPKDMFEGVEKVSPTPQAEPAQIVPPPTKLPADYGQSSMNSAPMMEHRGGGGTLKIVAIIAGILVILGVSGFFAYRIMVQPAVPDSVVNAVPDTGVKDDGEKPVSEKAPSGSQPPPNSPINGGEITPTETKNPSSLLDSDGDGLTNARELEVGTSVTKADTDGDGLGDKEEVEVYATDPRKTDTDGDGYLDGQEVSGGYNPNGAGKLFTVPQGS